MTQIKWQNGLLLKNKVLKNVLFKKAERFLFDRNANLVGFCNLLKRNCNIFAAFFSDL
jgi:hypothetical protein